MSASAGWLMVVPRALDCLLHEHPKPPGWLPGSRLGTIVLRSASAGRADHLCLGRSLRLPAGGRGLPRPPASGGLGRSAGPGLRGLIAVFAGIRRQSDGRDFSLALGTTDLRPHCAGFSSSPRASAASRWGSSSASPSSRSSRPSCFCRFPSCSPSCASGHEVVANAGLLSSLSHGVR